MRFIVILLVICSGCVDHVNSRGYIISQSPKEEPNEDAQAAPLDDGS